MLRLIRCHATGRRCEHNAAYPSISKEFLREGAVFWGGKSAAPRDVNLRASQRTRSAYHILPCALGYDGVRKAVFEERHAMGVDVLVG